MLKMVRDSQLTVYCLPVAVLYTCFGAELCVWLGLQILICVPVSAVWTVRVSSYWARRQLRYGNEWRQAGMHSSRY